MACHSVSNRKINGPLKKNMQSVTLTSVVNRTTMSNLTHRSYCTASLHYSVGVCPFTFYYCGACPGKLLITTTLRQCPCDRPHRLSHLVLLVQTHCGSLHRVPLAVPLCLSLRAVRYTFLFNLLILLFLRSTVFCRLLLALYL